MASYEFVTIWKFDAPIEAVWEHIYHTDRWPEWWRGVLKVEEVEKGDERGVGSVRRFTWKSKLPYLLIFELRTVRIEAPTLLEGAAVGELQGSGVWSLSQEGPITTARYDWKVETTKAWMNLLAPIARPAFNWNHDVVMRWGGEGLARKLGARLLEA